MFDVSLSRLVRELLYVFIHFSEFVCCVKLIVKRAKEKEKEKGRGFVKHNKCLVLKAF